MSFSGIQGQILEVTVVGCSKLRDTEWISRQDPYVRLEYGSSKFKTRTCTDGGKNPMFQEKFIFTLIEGLKEINLAVWNSNTLTADDLIGSGKVLLQKVLSQGFDDSSWSLQSKKGRYSGEVKLILHYQNVNKPAHSHSHTPSAPPYAAATAPPQPQCSHSSHSISYPPISNYPPVASYPPLSGYPPASSAYAPVSSYPPPASAYPSQPVPTYPPSTTYPPPPYPPPPPSVYPPAPYPPPYYPPPPYQQPPYPGCHGYHPPY